jgi:putative ABC transport system permease protein
MLVKVIGNNMQETISFLQKQWKIYSPGIPFEYKFLNEDFNLLYNSEARTMRIFFIFAAIAIFLACLGLFGLSAFSADQRIKEIGIRKTLGASTRNITVLLTTGFIKLVGISVIIATPLAWIGVSKWMQNFAYHIAIQWWMFALAGLIAILIAGLTISFHAIKTATVNPVKSLRTE